MKNERRIMRFPVTLDSVNRKKDRSLTLKQTTNLEVSNEDFANADTFVGHSGYLYFIENGELDAADVPKDDAPVDVGQKKPSVRLRAVLYRLYEQMQLAKGEPPDSVHFDRVWYPHQMERLIERYKQELD